MSKPEFASASMTAGQLNALVKIIGADNVLGILCGDLRVELKQFNLLSRVATAQIEATEKLVASEHIKSANIGYMWDGFCDNFSNMVEESVPAATIAVSRLEKASVDKTILAQLGDKAEIKLAHFFALLEKQSKGEDGVLLVNGYANIAYIRDSKGTLWAVGALWDSLFRCWDVRARSVGSPGAWGTGSQILSCDS